MALTGYNKFVQSIDYTVTSTTFEWKLQKSDVIFEREDKKTLKSNDFFLTNKEKVKCSTSLHIDASKYENNSNNDPYSKSLLIVTISPSEHDIAKLLIKVKINHASDESNSFKIESQTININGAQSTDAINLQFPLPDQTTPLILLVSNNELTIVIEIQDIRGSSRFNQSFEYKMKLTTAMFADLYKKQQLFDVTFIVGENNCEIKAHALVLAAASPYFSAMFNNNIKEKKEHIVDLTKDPDINEEIFKAFLYYIYGIKSVSELKNLASNLLVLADKYNMTELFKSCEILLSETLNKTNVASLLLFADKYECKLLKEKALDYAKLWREIEKLDPGELKERCEEEEFVKGLFSLIQEIKSYKIV